MSDERGSVPRFGESVISVPITVSMLRIAAQGLGLLGGGSRDKVTYSLEGKLGGSGFTSTRFQAQGQLTLPGTSAPRRRRRGDKNRRAYRPSSRTACCGGFSESKLAPIDNVMAKLFLALVLVAATPLAAQEFPNRPIRLITPAAQGGTTDLLARVFGQKLAESWGQQVLVDNRASAAGVIAGQLTTQAAPDGYTLLLAYHQHTVNAALNPKLPYHPVNDFTPITQLTSAGLMLVVNPSTPVNNLAEFMQWTKNFKGALNFGSAGIGSGGHLAGELFKLMAGVKAEHIPYKGAGPAMADLIAGQYHFNFSGLQGSQVQVRAGRLRAIAVTTPKRLPSNPELPAMAEVLPGFEVVGWYGVIGPANMPQPLVEKLHGELVKILNQPDVKSRIEADGSEPVGARPRSSGASCTPISTSGRSSSRRAARSWNEAVPAAGPGFGAGGPARAPRAHPAA